MNWKHLVALMLVAGCASAPAGPSRAVAEAAIVVQDSDLEPVGVGAAIGRPDALVTAVAFHDPAMPDWEATLTHLRATTLFAEGEVRVALKPSADVSPAGRDALIAMQAAAGQGKFWAMHDELIAWRDAWRDGGALPLAVTLAEDVGLELEPFRAALGTARADVAAQQQRSSAEGYTAGTLSLNGRLYFDDADTAKLDAALATVAEDARGLVTKGTARDALYATAVRANLSSVPFGPALRDSARLPVAGSPVFGNPDATVTVVAFMDLECPYSKRAFVTLSELVEADPDVRIVFKHLPLDFHKTARQAASLATAAQRQDKFWEIAGRLFEKGRSENLDEYAAAEANSLGLDVAKMFEDAKGAMDAVDRDLALAKQLGVAATPTFFVNGELFKGAQPLTNFRMVVDRRRDEANALSVPHRDVYVAAVEQAFENPSPTPSPRPDIPADAPQVVPVGPEDPAFGAKKDFLVTVVVFSDFQCPFCQRLAPTLVDLEHAYPATIRVVFKHLPLGFHQSADEAARAAVAAGKQGKFWEMHDLLFAEKLPAPAEMDAYTEKLAKKLGLKMTQFKADREAAQQKVDADTRLAERIGARGTPTSYVNGRKVSGARPLADLKDIIVEELDFAKTVARETELEDQELYEEILLRRVSK